MRDTATIDPFRTLQQLVGDDPWSLTLPERRQLHAAMDLAQRVWLPRLRRLVEPPAPGDDFPAFLLATEAFDDLRRRIGSADHPSQLDTATADTLQRFADRYRDYLRDDG